jgi:putative ABC transport system permease protein
MKSVDVTRFAFTALAGARKRTLLMLLAMATGIASVLILTSLGEAARRYVIGEFASLGTNLVIVMPGRSETAGAGPNMLMGETPRDLTLGDAMALTRSSAVRRIAPLNVGSAPVSWSGLEREVPILGTSSEMFAIRHWEMARGQFLPPGDIDRANPVCVLGTKVKTELFGSHSAMGEWVRIGDRRFRVIGVMASEGQSIGVSVEDVVFIPVASAQQLFNTSTLFRIFIEAKTRDAVPNVIEQTTRIISDRHQGEKDVTVITQDAVLATFDKILQTLTLSVAGIAAISLIVAGILIMNVMLVSVSQRTSEIGLLKALGTPDRQIVILFLAEAGLLSTAGAVLGVIFGEIGSQLIGYFYPVLPVGAPWWAFVAAIAVALITGLLFSLLPARRAAQLDPVEALARR